MDASTSPPHRELVLLRCLAGLPVVLLAGGSGASERERPAGWMPGSLKQPVVEVRVRVDLLLDVPSTCSSRRVSATATSAALAACDVHG